MFIISVGQMSSRHHAPIDVEVHRGMGRGVSGWEERGSDNVPFAVIKVGSVSPPTVVHMHKFI